MSGKISAPASVVTELRAQNTKNRRRSERRISEGTIRRLAVCSAPRPSRRIKAKLLFHGAGDRPRMVLASQPVAAAILQSVAPSGCAAVDQRRLLRAVLNPARAGLCGGCRRALRAQCVGRLARPFATVCRLWRTVGLALGLEPTKHDKDPANPVGSRKGSEFTAAHTRIALSAGVNAASPRAKSAIMAAARVIGGRPQVAPVQAPRISYRHFRDCFRRKPANLDRMTSPLACTPARSRASSPQRVA